jgi:hypothetical protein
MNNRDANLKQILSCDVLDPSVAYATGAFTSSGLVAMPRWCEEWTTASRL